MTNFKVDYSFKEIGWGTLELEADDKDQAEFDVLNYVRDSNPDAVEVEVTSIEEI